MLTDDKFFYQFEQGSHETSFAEEGRKECCQTKGGIKRYLNEEETKKVHVERTFQGNQEETCKKGVENKKSKERDKVSARRSD
jgi:hypothetical protein